MKRCIAYLVSRYPAVSHTFIVSEVRKLREMGFEIVTASINVCDREASLRTTEEMEEVGNTYYIKNEGVLGALRGIIAVLPVRPLKALGGFTFAISTGWKISATFRWMGYWIEALLLGSWMLRKRSSHLHVHLANNGAAVALLASKIFDIPYSLTVHGPDEFYDVSQGCLREKIDGASWVCCISKFTRSQLMLTTPPECWDKLLVSHLGVDVKMFSASSREPGENLEILCVGRLVSAKGQHILLEAVKGLVDAHHRVHVRLVGEGPLRGLLESRVAEYGLGAVVSLEGACNTDEVKKYLQAADVFVLPSFAEGLPIVLMEAMSMGLPCVSTFVAGIPELIRNDIEGLLVFPSDAAALKEALELLIDDVGLRERLGKTARARVLERFDLESSVRRFGGMLLQRLEGNHRC